MSHNNAILEKIECVCLDVTKNISLGIPPKLCFPRRTNWNELVFDETIKLNPLQSSRAFSSVDTKHRKSLKKFAVILKVLKTIYTLIQEDRYCTKRDIFYQYPDLYANQQSMDKIIEDIAYMLEVPRWDLHILATSKGLVAGDLQFQDETGMEINCQHTTTGIQIPAHLKDMQGLITGARFVFVVEKDATFQKLLGYQFCQKMNPCILVTGKGFPDNGTRLLLRQLWLQYKLPIFILVDADPHGIEIMAVYKYGSMSHAFENQHLAVPQAEWLGIWPEDIDRLSLKASSLAPLTERDFRKARSLKERPYARDDDTLISQIDLLIKGGQKAEIQSLDSISSNYLCDIYIPSKINPLFLDD